MKTLNLLQNMSAEAKVLAMALPMLLLSAMSAKSAIIEVRSAGHLFNMPPCAPQSGDSASVQPVEKPAQDYQFVKFPGQKPEDAGLDNFFKSGKPMPMPASPDSASVEPVGKKKEEKLPGKKKPKSPGLDSFWWGGKPIPASPDSASVEPTQKPAVNSAFEPSFPGMKNDEPEQDGRYVPRIPGDEDVYGSIHISGSQQYPAAIAEVAVDNQPAKQAQGVFTLSGFRVSESADLSGLAPGLYIVNGKKMLVR